MLVLKQDLYGYKEELEVKALNDEGIFASGDKIKKYIPNIEDRDIENFIIVKSKLLYIGTNESETSVAEKLGLGDIGSGFSDAKAVIEEVQAIVDGVLDLTKDKEIGVKLVDRGSHLIDGTWNILIDYDKNNEETGRYEGGYYWLKKGEKYKIDNKEIEFKNDYVVNYNTKEYSVLSERVVNWNQNNVLAVPEYENGKKVLALNLDTLSFENGQWKNHANESKGTTGQEEFEDFYVKENQGDEDYSVYTGIQKTGDVVYDRNSGALKFNEDSEENPEGEGGYIKLSKTGDGESIDFSNGFTFEMYCELSRFSYLHAGDQDVLNGSGFFCRIPSLSSDFLKSLRFGMNDDRGIAKFYDRAGYGPSKGKVFVSSGNSINFGDADFFSGKIYFTAVYDRINVEENVKKLDKFIIYKNGEYYGETYYGHDNFNSGLEYWNGDECPYFLGVCPLHGTGKLFYLKGLVYSTRLYTKPMTEDQVKNSYDMTLKYRSSFLGK